MRPDSSHTAIFSGVSAAAITPHPKTGFQPDFGLMLEVVDFLGSAGVKSIALLGATGEFVHLEREDRVRLVHLAAKRSRAPILAGVSHSTCDGAIELARHAISSGAAALLVMPPYFYRYGQEEIREFYLRFADAIRGVLPLVLYNLPQYAPAIAPETATELLHAGFAAAIKDSSGDWENLEALLRGKTERPFSLLVGNDSLFLRGRRAGADGVISGCACAVPELLLGIERAVAVGSPQADRFGALLDEFIERIDRFPGPNGIREAIALRGIRCGGPASPLGPASQKRLEDFRQWFPPWLETVKREVAA